MPEAVPDELADSFGSGGEAVGPSIVVDLLDELLWQGDDDAGVRLPWLGWHGPMLHPQQLCVNMAGMPGL